MKIITSTDLQHWAYSRESEHCLPLLLRRLIINKVGFNNIRFIDIPGGDSVWKPGVDGKLLTLVDSILGEKDKNYVIECGEAEDAEKKFRADLVKRTKELNGERQNNTIFVFITTHKFEDKAATLEKIKNTETNTDLWAEIELFDADDIETWLNHDFATTAWLADIMGKPSNGLKSFEKIWENWMASTEVCLDADVILARNNTYQNEIQNFLNTERGMFSITSPSRYESLLFFLASVQKSPLKQNIVEAIKSKIVMVEDNYTWNRLVDDIESKKLMLVPLFGTPDDLGALIDKGYQIFIPRSENDGKAIEKNTVYIEPFNNSLLSSILETKMKSYERSNQIIRKLGHNGTLLHLQRLLRRKDVLNPAPKWATKENCEILLLSALIGGWSDNNDKDKEFVSAIFKMDYAEVVKKLSFHIKTEEAPVKRIGNNWEAVSPELVIEYLGGYFTEDALVSYLQETKKVLLEISNVYNNTGNSSLVANYDYTSGKYTYYSKALIRGIARGYAAVVNNSDSFVYLNDISTKIQNQIQDILNGKNWKLWATLNPVLPYLAEAGQDNFLTVLQHTIDNSPNVIVDLYEKGEDVGFIGECLYSGVLWGLESLAWFDKFFVRVVNILIDMERLCTKKLKFGNSPFDSLSRIFCTWNSHTLVDFNGRKILIGKLLETNKNSDIVFRLLYSLLPTSSMFTQCTNMPEFIELTFPQKPTVAEINEFHNFIFDKIISLLGTDNGRWENMIKYITYMSESWFDKMIFCLHSIEWKNVDYNFKKFMYQNLENWISYSQRWGEESQQECGAEKKRAKLIEIVQSIALDNPIDENIQLFAQHNFLDYKEPGQPSEKLQNAIKEILSAKGVNGLIELAEQIEAVEVLGEELVFTDMDNSQVIEIFNHSERQNPKVLKFLCVFFAVLISVKGLDFINKIFNDKWPLEYKEALTNAVNGNEEYWNWLAMHGLSAFYWKNINFLWPRTEKEYIIAVSELKKAENFVALVRLISMRYQRKQSINPIDVMDTLFGIARTNKKGLNAMGGYYIQNAFRSLYEKSNIDETALFNLELIYFDLFDGHNGLEPKAMYKKLKTDPSLFFEVLKTLHIKDSELEGKTQEEISQLKVASRIAFNLLMKLEQTYIFNSQEELNNWLNMVIEALSKFDDKELVAHGFSIIGSMLANCPKDSKDGIWPVAYVRRQLEEILSPELIEGIKRAKINSVGVRYIDRANPGKYWKEKAEEQRINANKLRFSYPKTAELLDSLAKTFEWNANQEEKEVASY